MRETDISLGTTAIRADVAVLSVGTVRISVSRDHHCLPTWRNHLHLVISPNT